MKKILKKVGKGLSKLKSKRVKIIAIAVLAVAMLVDLNPFFLKAGRENLPYTHTVYRGVMYDNLNNNYHGYTVATIGGNQAYCIDYGIDPPFDQTSLQYKKTIRSNKLVAVINNGYPNKTVSQLGAKNANEAYFGTQLAVWQAVNGTSDTKGQPFNLDKIQATPNNVEKFANAKKIAKKILDGAKYNPSVSISGGNVDYDSYVEKNKIGPFKFNVVDYTYTVFEASVSNAPKGTQIVDKNNKIRNKFNKGEEIYVLVDKNANPTNVTLNIKAVANEKVGVIYGGKSALQYYVFLDSEQKNVSASKTFTWEESKGNIKIVKSDQDKKPIQGAEFSLVDANGKQVSTGKTDSKGNLSFNKLAIGNYTITETYVPDGYIIQKSSYPVTVSRNKTNQINVQNTKVKGVLQITKLEKQAKTPIPGAVFEIYDKDGKVVEKLTTNENGIATSSELPKGSYTYKEISVPDGYILDTQVRKFEIAEKISAVRETITNERIVGKLQIIKIGDDGEKPLEGAEFEVYDKDKKVVEKLVTDKNGKATSKQLAKGSYSYKETKAPDGYDLDTKEYTFKIETLNQVVEQNIIDKKIYGKIKIQKVDESDKAISDVKFEIINKENKVVATVTTDQNGIATVENLPVGKYKYREIDTPYLYVLDENQYDFEITSEKREAEVKVVNQRAKGIIKILKIDKDSKTAIANAKFNVIDKSNNDIVDAIVTDENGVARTKALPTGEYIYQEVEVPEEYIIDNKTYDVKIKKNNETVEKKVSNEHKKLPVTGGFLSTDILIVVIVTAGSVIVYIVFKIIQNKKNNPNPPYGSTPNDNNPFINNPNSNNAGNIEEENHSVDTIPSDNNTVVDDKININNKEQNEKDSLEDEIIVKKVDTSDDNYLEDEMLDLTPNYSNENHVNINTDDDKE